MVSLLIGEDWKFAMRENGTNIVAHWATMRQPLPASSLDTQSFPVSHMYVHSVLCVTCYVTCVEK